jgi:hypothetical protein
LNYNSFIFSQYFAEIIDGNPAADETTLWVKALISALPSTITLSHATQIQEARDAFNTITSYTQQSLVDNLSKLEEAEKVLKYLQVKEENKEDEPEVEEPIVTQPKEEGMPGYAVVLLVMAGVILIGGACVLAFIFVRRKNNAVSTEAVEIEETAEIVVEEDNNTQE